jgi:acyl-CoA dehydrogenase
MPFVPEHLAWPFFEPRHRELATDFAAWAARHLGDADNEDGSAARDMFKSLAAGGWLDASLPAESDGRAPDLRAACLMREILAFESVAADVAFSEPWLGILPIHLYGSTTLRKAYVPAYRAGALVPAFALSEPDTGSDVSAITTTAQRDGAHFVLNGTKTWTSNAGTADVYVVFARTGEPNRLSAFAVDTGTAGLFFEQPFAVMSPHAVATWHLRDCRISADCLIGELDEGLPIAMASLEAFRPTVGAAALGMSRRAMSEAVARSLQRTAFKKPIAEHQLVQAKIASMSVQVDASALLVYRAAWQADTSDSRIAREAATAKLYSTEAAFNVIDQAVQLFGGLGVRHGTVVERLYRHARPCRIFDGTSEIQQLIIAREVLRR